MKKLLYLLTTLTFLTAIFLACEEEENKLYDFSLEYSNTGTIDKPIPISFKISEDAVDFRFKYTSKSSGAGIFVNADGETIKEDTYISVNTQDQLFYIGSTLGQHKVEIITLNNRFKSEDLKREITFTINHLNITWTATTEKDTIVLGEKLPITLTLEINGVDETQTDVTFVRNYRSTEGVATLENEQAITVPFDEKNEIVPGVYKLFASADQLGSATINFELTDSNSQVVEQTVSFKVVENDPPVITLVGEENMIVGLNQPYEEEGAIAFDEQDGNLTETIEIDDAAIDISKAGVYQVIYSVTDSASATTSIIRTVTVKEIEIEAIEITPTASTLAIGETQSLTVVFKPENASNQSIEWSSEDLKIITIDEKGEIAALGVGETKITATTANEKTATAIITVVAEPIEVISISFIPDAATLNIGQQPIKLNPKILPVEAENVKLEWTSSNPSIVSVENGIVTPLTIGVVTISAKADNDVEGTIKITVEDVGNLNPVTKVIVTPSSATKVVGDPDFKLVTEIEPNIATDKGLVWISSDDEIATVNQNGTVSLGDKTGTVTITAVASNGIKGEAAITVTPVVTSIAIAPTTVSVNKGQTTTLTATLLPADLIDKTVKWESDDLNIATVDENSGVVTAMAKGTANIIAKSGNVVSNVTVVNVKQPVMTITVALAKTSILDGANTQATATVEPINSNNLTVTWSSSNTSVATVNDTGKVVGVAPGSAKITATAKDGSKVFGTATITVTPILVNKITVTIDKSIILKGGSAKATAVVRPTTVNNSAVTWTSSNTAVATINASTGQITGGTRGGSATITATAKDGSGVNGTASIRNNIPLESIKITNAANSLVPSNGKLPLNITYGPANATNKGSIAWSSNNNTIATVSSSGEVIGKSRGTVTITANSNQPGVANKSIKLQVYQSPPTLAANGDFYGKPGDVVKVFIEARKVTGSSDVRADTEVRIAKNKCFLKSVAVSTNGANSKSAEFTYTIPADGYAIFSFIRRSFDKDKSIPSAKFNFTIQNTTFSQNMDIIGLGSNIKGFRFDLNPNGVYQKCN